MLSGKRKNAIRIQKQNQLLIKDPIDGVLVKKDGDLDFHFVIHKLDAPYKNGFYHGLLQLHPDYPFAAPKLFMYTPSGRFETNMSICTSFTVYHQQSWSMAWNVRTLLLGTVSFMTSEEGSYGVRNQTAEQRAEFAEKSMEFNLKNQKFCQLFLQDMVEMGLIGERSVHEKKEGKQNINSIDQIEKDLTQNQVKRQEGRPKRRQGQQNRQNREQQDPFKKFFKICLPLVSVIVIGLLWKKVKKSWFS